MNSIFALTRSMRHQSRTSFIVYTVMAVLVALAMFVAASGEGSPDTAEPLPDWVNVSANIFAASVGLLVLVPRTRAFGSLAAAANMMISMVLNYRVDGVAFFLMALPFNLITIVLATALAWRYRADLRRSDPAHR